MDPIGFSKKGNRNEIFAFGRTGGETKIFKSDGKTLLKSFIEKYSKALGPSAEEIIAERRKSKRNEKRRLKEAEKKLKQMQNVNAQNEKASQKLDALICQQNDSIQEEIETYHIMSLLLKLNKKYKILH